MQESTEGASYGSQGQARSAPSLVHRASVHYGFRTRESIQAGHKKPVGRFPFDTRMTATEEAFCGFGPSSWQPRVRTSSHNCPVIYWQSCVRYLASIHDDRLGCHSSLIFDIDRSNQIIQFSFLCFESSSPRIMCKLFALLTRARFLESKQ